MQRRKLQFLTFWRESPAQPARRVMSSKKPAKKGATKKSAAKRATGAARARRVPRVKPLPPSVASIIEKPDANASPFPSLFEGLGTPRSGADFIFGIIAFALGSFFMSRLPP